MQGERLGLAVGADVGRLGGEVEQADELFTRRGQPQGVVAGRRVVK
jgi:hypothetical protein